VAQPETANTADSQPVKDPLPFQFKVNEKDTVEHLSDLYKGFMQERLKREQEEKKHKIEQYSEALRDTIIVKVLH
ncbi:hypothetical protein A2U01_0021900, partial [Trifolium medium]|nr:hypothetical protein [Trifolium medium]